MNLFLLFWFIVLCISVHHDRVYRSSEAKWAFLIIGAFIWAVATIITDSFSSIGVQLSAVFTFINIAWYMGVGLLYSLFELVYQIFLDRKAALISFKVDTVTKNHGHVYNVYEMANNKMVIVKYTCPIGEESYTPSIDKSIALNHMGAWLFFWPAYLVELVFGRLVKSITSLVVDLFAKMFGGLIKKIFPSGVDIG